jgi:hypothetical protein
MRSSFAIEKLRIIRYHSRDEGSSPHAILYLRAQAPASRFFFGTDFNNSTTTEAASQRARKLIERAAHV